MIREFGRNFTPMSNAALRGTGSQTIFRNIPKGGVKPLLLLLTALCNLAGIFILADKGCTFGFPLASIELAAKK
jgi:hypothetical protein